MSDHSAQLPDPDVSGPRPPLPARLLAETAAMVRFYSRIPLPALGRFDDPATPPPFAEACRMLPLAAIAIAAPPAILCLGLGATALPSAAIAVATVACGVVTTGALHEDGLADVADGFGGGRTRERKLEIMKDSSIGAYGAMALVLATLARVGLIAAMVAGPIPYAAPPFLAAPGGLVAAAILSRVLSLALFHVLPPARTDGVAGRVGQPTRGATVIAGLLAMGLTLAVAGPEFGVARVLLAVALAGATTVAFGRLAVRHVGGQTGDVVGAAQQLAEIGFLAGLLLV